MSVARLLAVSAIVSGVASVSGCATEAPSETGTRTIAGTVDLRAYNRLSNPAVIAETRTGRTFVAPIARTGTFRLSIPSGEPVHLFLANATKAGGYQAASDVVWGLGEMRWGKLRGGSNELNLGTIRPRAALATRGVTPQSGGGSGSGSGSGKDTGQSSGSGGDIDDNNTEGGEGEDCHHPGRADLPYNVNLALGQTFRLSDAFRQKGPAPKSVVSLTGLDGSTPVHLAELKSDTPFAVAQADCDRTGNKGTGRDRFFITWQNFDGSTESDHFTIRYCNGSGGGTGSGTAAVPTTKVCDVPVCDDSPSSKSGCDKDGLDPVDDAPSSKNPCPPPANGGDTPNPDPHGEGSPCITYEDCSGNLQCFESTCTTLQL